MQAVSQHVSLYIEISKILEIIIRPEERDPTGTNPPPS
jgi:hypothetical protein